MNDFQKIANCRVYLDIYGDLDDSNRAIAKDFKENVVHVNFHNRVSHEESWKIQCKSDLLVLFTWESTSSSLGHIPLRSYEFAACGRPVIVMTDHKNSSSLDFMPKGNFHQVSDPQQILRLLSHADDDLHSDQKGNLVDQSLTYTDRALRFVDVFEKAIRDEFY